MTARRLLGMAWLGGCGGPDDASRYRHALAAPPAEAVALCGRLADTALGQECATEAAVRAASTGDEPLAVATCSGLPPGLWADECWFQVVDALKLEGSRAWSLCEQAGRYRDYCVGHAVNRSLDKLGPDAIPLDVGAEDKLVVKLRKHVRKSGAPLPREHQSTVVFTAAARHLAARWAHRAFDPAECGVAPADLCARAYAETMPEGSVDRVAACRGPLSSAGVQAAGGTPWVDAAEPVVRPVWDALCVAAGERQGDEADARGPRSPQEGARPRASQPPRQPGQ